MSPSSPTAPSSPSAAPATPASALSSTARTRSPGTSKISSELSVWYYPAEPRLGICESIKAFTELDDAATHTEMRKMRVSAEARTCRGSRSIFLRCLPHAASGGRVLYAIDRLGKCLVSGVGSCCSGFSWRSPSRGGFGGVRASSVRGYQFHKILISSTH